MRFQQGMQPYLYDGAFTHAGVTSSKLANVMYGVCVAFFITWVHSLLLSHGIQNVMLFKTVVRFSAVSIY